MANALKQDDLLAAMRTLGLPATPAALAALTPMELRRAHRERAAESHPDVSGGDAWSFIATQEAFETLSRHLGAENSIQDEPAAAGPMILAVGGAKGGVGKSLVSSSIASLLAAGGKRVAAVDLDLGAPNLHLLLGVKRPALTLGDFWEHRAKDLISCAQPTAVPGLDLIAGEGARVGAANPEHQRKLRLIRHLRELPHDVVICDLGAGTSLNTLDFWLAASRRILVATPEPTAILDAYGMIKTALFRHLIARVKAAPGAADAAILEFLQSRGADALSLRGFLAHLAETDPPSANRLREWVRVFRFELVLNQSRGEVDMTMLGRVTELAQRNLSLAPPSVRRLPRENGLAAAVARLVPFVVTRPDSEWTVALAAGAARLAYPDEDAGVRAMLTGLALAGDDVLERIRTQNFEA